MMWELPKSVEIGGTEYSINTDFRIILNIILKINDISGDKFIQFYIMLAMFYPDFEKIPENCYQEAIEKMFWFISCGEPDDGQTHAKLIDWEQDYSLIVSGINKIASCDVRGLEFLHWWTFMSYFNEIGDGQLATVVSIREKRRKHKKLDKWEQDFYKKNRARIDFKRKYTQQEDETIGAWIGKSAP